MEVLKKIIPYFWMPQWCGLMIDPFARADSIILIINLSFIFFILYIQLKVIIKYKY